MEQPIYLNKKQVAFLMYKFKTADPEKAVDWFLESLIEDNKDPLMILKFLNEMMAKDNN